MIPGSANPLLLKSAAAAGGYQIERSLRFNSSDSGFLSRTPASAGNRKTYTIALWVKSAVTGASNRIFGARNDANNYMEAYITSGNKIDWYFWGGGLQYELITTQVFRDPSAWYHLMFVLDTTQATANNRIRIYVNGSEVTTFDNRVNPSLNFECAWNNTVTNRIGVSVDTSSAFFNGYLADIHFIDGQALTPSSFTEVSATTGQLIPKAYAGTYTGNSFWLKFNDNSAATAATLGKDSFLLGNNWTPNNVSVVGGPANIITTPSSNAPPTIDYLVVAGGAGGGYGTGSAGRGAGGGGAGGLLTASSYSISAGTPYSISVGQGGAAGTSINGLNGGDSVFHTFTAVGGGGGAQQAGGNGSSGGSGGGGGAQSNGSSVGLGAVGTAGQGNTGGNGHSTFPGGGGGGGGAGGAGQVGTAGAGGAGGTGVSNSYSGGAVTYATGGAGGGATTPVAGSANTGNGGGGATQAGVAAAAGGSGIVIIRYANTYADLTVASSLTYTYANTGGYKIYSFTASVTPAQSAGNDSLVDTPTSYGTDTGAGGEVRGNYATLNPLATVSDTLSNGNLDWVSGTAANRITKNTIGMSAGKWYAEFVYTGTVSGTLVGICTAEATGAGGVPSTGYTYYQNGNKFIDGTGSAYGASWTTNDVIGIALDFDSNQITFYKNNTSQGAISITSGLTWNFCCIGSSVNDKGTWNFGQRPFAYTAPSGFKALCDTNLISTTITTSGSYTGNGVADGPFVYLNGVPTAMTIGGNAVTFGTHADKLANGFKIRTSSTTYNQNASSYSYSITSTGAAFKNARAQPNP